MLFEVYGITDFCVPFKNIDHTFTLAHFLMHSYAFLKRNGQSVLALATSFEKLDKAGGGKVPKFLSTHPDSKARAARVRARAKKEGLR